MSYDHYTVGQVTLAFAFLQRFLINLSSAIEQSMVYLGCVVWGILWDQNPAKCIAVTDKNTFNKFTFSHFADDFIQSDLQMRTVEAIKTNYAMQVL